MNIELSEDLYENIFNFLHKIDNIYIFRLINNTCNKIFIYYFLNIKVDIFPSITFIKYNECSICYKCNNNIRHFLYNYDKLPHKTIVHCDEKYCNLMTIKRYLLDIKKNNIYPFCDYLDTKNLFIKLNHKYLDFNIMKNIYINTLKLYNKKWYVKCDMVYREKYIYIENIDGLSDNNLFSWFLDRKKIN